MGPRRHASRFLTAVGATLLAAAPLSATAAGAAATTVSPSWTGGAALPPAPGYGVSRNEDGEPGMGVSPDGRFWVASDVAPYAADDTRASSGALSGADIWTSTDHGKTYRWVADPFDQSGGQGSLAGEDTDLTVAPEKNSSGHYTVYATSLWIGASSLAWSTDDGATWTVNPLGGVPAQDRPWLAADGPCTIYLSYHQLPAFTPVISTYDVCSNGNVPARNGATLDPVNETMLTASDFPGLSNSFNKLVVDTSPTSPHRHTIYQPMSLCQAQQPGDILTNATASSGCPQGTQYLVAVSTDNGQTFTYHRIALDPTGATLVWASTVATDAAGNVYFAWSDNKNSYLDVSTDGGSTWSKPAQLNPAGTVAVYPTVAAGPAGRVDVAWYGADRAGDANNSAVMGAPGSATGAVWSVRLARSTDGGSTFTTSQVTDAIHRGYLCTQGGNCSSDGSRNLLDDFGLSIDPTTGLDSATYTSDQPDNSAGHAFTGYTTELGATPTPDVPESSTPALLAVAGGVAIAGGIALRRRRSPTS